MKMRTRIQKPYGRQIHIAKKVWTYRIGNGYVWIRDPSNTKTTKVDFKTFTGVKRDWDPPFRQKVTISPKDVKDFIANGLKPVQYDDNESHFRVESSYNYEKLLDHTTDDLKQPIRDPYLAGIMASLNNDKDLSKPNVDNQPSGQGRISDLSWCHLSRLFYDLVVMSGGPSKSDSGMIDVTFNNGEINITIHAYDIGNWSKREYLGPFDNEITAMNALKSKIDVARDIVRMTREINEGGLNADD